MEKLGQHGSRGVCTPAWQARIAIRRISHQRWVAGDGRRRDAKLLDDPWLV